MLNLAEHEIYAANKYQNANICWHFNIDRKIFILNHVELKKKFKLLIFWHLLALLKLMLNWIEHEKFYIPRPKM